jgi:heptosyltransferase-2
MSEPPSVLVLAPNWLGDAVMALPAIGDIRRRFAASRLVLAARRGVADLFRLVPFVDEVLTLQWRGELYRRGGLRADVAQLRTSDARVAVLLPNSFASAWLVHRAGIAERWGFAADFRTRLLTRTAAKPRRPLHQAEYYQDLVRQLGMENGPLEPEVLVPPTAREAARTQLAERGWNGRAPFVAIAPGAAYGRAKQWIPAHFVALIERLIASHGVMCVLVGSRADAPITGAIRSAIAPPNRSQVIDLAGVTSLESLAAVLEMSQACVSNDSGAMHVAAAVGAPVVAIFGPTIDAATRPLTRRGGRADVLTHPVWCRPCMLRECPIDHRCMTGIPPQRVLAVLSEAGRIPQPVQPPAEGAR